MITKEEFIQKLKEENEREREMGQELVEFFLNPRSNEMTINYYLNEEEKNEQLFIRG
jgi:hypothetical protein